MSVSERLRARRFEAVVLPHLPAAYNLARWIARNDADSADVVQEAMTRAFRYFDGFRGGDPRSWLLQIVRNTAYSWLAANRPAGRVDLTQDMVDGTDADDHAWGRARTDSMNPEVVLTTRADAHRLRTAIAKLPLDQREVLVLREFEDLSYKEIAAITGTPIGTVMSRLSRARDQLAEIVSSQETGS